MSYGVGHRHSSDPELLWLWCRPAAIAWIQPLAWESPYTMGVALDKTKKKKKKKKKKDAAFLKMTFLLRKLLAEPQCPFLSL